MESIKQNLGVDISKDTFSACFMSLSKDFKMEEHGSKSLSNSLTGFEQMLAWITPLLNPVQELHITMEATGVYYESLAYYLIDKGFIVHVVLPNQSKRYAESLGAKSKTDKIDARILAHMGIERDLRHWHPLSKLFLTLKQLTRERETLVQERTNVKNQLHAYSHQGIIHQCSIARCRERITFLNHQIKEIEQEISQTVKQDQQLCERIENLQSIPGVGLITAVCVVAETNGFVDICNAKQLTSFAGLDVRIAESGQWKGNSRISKKGNSHIRKILYFPAFTISRLDKQMQQFYSRLKEKKGKPMIAAVAVQRKLLCLMYTIWRKNEKYCADYLKNQVA